jgi:hypothetical protein
VPRWDEETWRVLLDGGDMLVCGVGEYDKTVLETMGERCCGLSGRGLFGADAMA